jgi:hypothetical protein
MGWFTVNGKERSEEMKYLIHRENIERDHWEDQDVDG